MLTDLGRFVHLVVVFSFFFFSGTLCRVMINSSFFFFFFSYIGILTVLQTKTKRFYLKHGGRNSLRVCLQGTNEEFRHEGLHRVVRQLSRER